MSSKVLRCVLLAALAAALPARATAGELKLTMQNGRVTVIADNVPLRQILQEWARIGQTTILNVDKLGSSSVTLQLVDMPERDALDILLRSASGYIAAPRAAAIANAAVYDRVTIFVASMKAPTGPVASAAPPPTFQRPPQADDDEPINVQMPPQMVNPVTGAPPAAGQFPGMPPQLPPQVQQQLQQLQQMQQQQAYPTPTTSPTPGPLTVPRPGALPQPAAPAGVPNPYQPYQPVPTKPGGGGPGGADNEGPITD